MKNYPQLNFCPLFWQRRCLLLNLSYIKREALEFSLFSLTYALIRLYPSNKENLVKCTIIVWSCVNPLNNIISVNLPLYYMSLLQIFLYTICRSFPFQKELLKRSTSSLDHFFGAETRRKDRSLQLHGVRSNYQNSWVVSALETSFIKTQHCSLNGYGVFLTIQLPFGAKLFNTSISIPRHSPSRISQYPNREGRGNRYVCATIFQNAEAKMLVTNGVRKCIGNGANTLFWYDSWLSKAPLKKAFPRLFSIAINQQATVASQGFWEGFNWVWTFMWRRELRPMDAAEKVKLDSLLQHVCLDHDAKDKLIWAHEKSGSFSAKSFTRELDKLKPVPHNDAIKGVWRGLVPHRIEVFVWTALLGKINTRNKLASIGIIPTQNDICPLCLSCPETTNHLLLHCEMTRQIWVWWLNLWSYTWVFPYCLKDAFNQWKCIKKEGKFFKKVWSDVFFIILWTMWKERNLRIFGDSQTSIKDLQDLVLLRLGWWISAWKEDFPYSPVDIQRNPRCITGVVLGPCSIDGGIGP